MTAPREWVRGPDAGKWQPSWGKDRCQHPRTAHGAHRDLHPKHRHSGLEYAFSRSTDSFQPRFSLCGTISESLRLLHVIYVTDHARQPKEARNHAGPPAPAVPTRGRWWVPLGKATGPGAFLPLGRGAITLAGYILTLRDGCSVRTVWPALPAKADQRGLQTRGTFPKTTEQVEKDLSWSRLELKWPFSLTSSREIWKSGHFALQLKPQLSPTRGVPGGCKSQRGT